MMKFGVYFNSFQCCEMLDHLGIPFVQSYGEAEAMCAFLNKHGVSVSTSIWLLCGSSQSNCAYIYMQLNKQKKSKDKKYIS